MVRCFVMENSKKKFVIVTLGCRTNQYESSAYTCQLEKMGYIAAGEGEEADLCIVNTCTVTASADSHSRHQIRALKRKHPTAKLVVTGCMTEKNKGVMDAFPEIDLVVPNLQKEKLINFVFPETEELPEFVIEHFSAHTRAFVKVQDGCNSFCSYCIIPYVRGRSRSRSVSEIVKECQNILASGYKEIVITGINVGDFDGGEEKARLSDLVRTLDQLEGLERLRISSIDADEVDDDLLDAVTNGKKTCQSMHIVLQAGSNAVLKRMNRKYTKQIFLETLERIRQVKPDFTFTTDIIVGFPGETEQDFQETLEVMQAAKFVKVHMFPYSDRERTRAFSFPNKVAPQRIEERRQKVLREAERIAFSERQKYVGQVLSVLLESEEKGAYLGHTDNFLLVKVYGQHLASNQIVKVHIQENQANGLVGIVI